MDSITGVNQSVILKRGDEYVQVKALKLDGDTEAIAKKYSRLNFDGQRYYRQTIQEKDSDGNTIEKSIYVCVDEEAKKVIPEKLIKGNQCAWDRGVDQFFDGIEKDFMGIDANKTCTDEVDDGNIGFEEASKHVVRGALTKPARAIAKHPIWTGLAIGGGAVLCFFCPPAGTALLYAGLALGAGTAAVGTYQMATAKTDAQARNAWENIGSGVETAALSAMGIKHSHEAAAAKASADAANVVNNSTGTIEAAKATKLTSIARQDAITQIDAVKSLAGQGYLSTEAAKAEIANILQTYHAADSSAKVATQAAATISKLAPTAPSAVATTGSTTAATTSEASAIDAGRQLASDAIHAKIDAVKKPFKAMGKYAHPVKDVKNATKIASEDSSLQLAKNAIRHIAPKSGFKTQGLQYVKDLFAEATKLVSQGKPLEAKEAMIMVSKTLKAGTFADGELAAAKELAKATSELVSTATFMPKSLGIMGSMYLGAMANDDMLLSDELAQRYPALVVE